jgi:hypothetical protein
MSDLRNRFRTLDELPTPDLWREAQARARALPQRRPLTVSWALVALILLLALAIGTAALIGSGIVKLPVYVEVSPSEREATPGPSGTAEPELPLGGGLMLVYAAEPDPDTGAFDVFTLDAGTGKRTLLGMLPPLDASSLPYDLQWAADREHVLVTENSGGGPVALDSVTDAGRKLSFICCEPAAQGGVLSPQSDRIASVFVGDFAIPGCLLCADAPAVVSVLDADGGNLRTFPLPKGTLSNSQVSWSPDGSAVVVSGCRPCNIAGAIEGGGYGPTLTPNPAVEHAHLFIVRLDGSPVRELLDEAETMFWSATWSPDGATIAFVRTECPPDEHAPYCIDGTRSVVTLAVANGQQTVVADMGGYLPGPPTAHAWPSAMKEASSSWTRTGVDWRGSATATCMNHPAGHRTANGYCSQPTTDRRTPPAAGLSRPTAANPFRSAHTLAGRGDGPVRGAPAAP